MGHLKDIANQSKIQSFPSATFEIAGEVPASQCSEARIEGEHGQSTLGSPFFQDIGKFIGWDLAGKVCHITAPPPNVDDYNIINNSDDILRLAPEPPTTSNDNVYFITNGGALILTRDVPSFAKFISDAGYAYTIKGGKLYTNIPSNQLQNACTILFDPLT